MRISTKLRYGMRAMVDIALHIGNRPILIHEIADRQQISKKYLEQMLLSLQKAGLVRSIRGSKGGYILSRPPEQISLKDIAVSLEGPLTLVQCVSDPKTCSRNDLCATIDLWKELSLRIYSYLSEQTLADLVMKARKKRAFAPLNFEI